MSIGIMLDRSNCMTYVKVLEKAKIRSIDVVEIYLYMYSVTYMDVLEEHSIHEYCYTCYMMHEA